MVAVIAHALRSVVLAPTDRRDKPFMAAVARDQLVANSCVPLRRVLGEMREIHRVIHHVEQRVRRHGVVEVEEVAEQIDVLVILAPIPGQAPRVDQVHQQQCGLLG